MIVRRCKIRLEKGICDLPSVGEIEVGLVPHNFVWYIEDISLQKVPVCQTHHDLFKQGWKLQGTLVFRWVPPRA